MNYALWIIQVLLGLLFVFAGSMKFIMTVEEMTKDVAMPGWFLHFIGVGEGIEDLEPFVARDFARAIAGLEQAA